MFEDHDSTFVKQMEGKTSTNYVQFYRHYVEKFNEHRDYVLIVCPGQSKTEVRRPVQDKDKNEYPREWRSYQDGTEQQIQGTALQMLGIDSGLVDALKAKHVHTIEQLGGLSDLGLQAIMGGNELRKRAQAFLAKNTTEVIELREKVADMQAQLAKQSELQATVEALQEQLSQFANRKKPGPKPKGTNGVATYDHSNGV